MPAHGQLNWSYDLEKILSKRDRSEKIKGIINNMVDSAPNLGTSNFIEAILESRGIADWDD
jgi:hypothetical protein